MKVECLVFVLDSIRFTLIFCVEHQICLVRHSECFEIEILCSKETTTEHRICVFVLDIYS